MTDPNREAHFSFTPRQTGQSSSSKSSVSYSKLQHFCRVNQTETESNWPKRTLSAPCTALLPHPATPFLKLVLEQIRDAVLEPSAATGLCDRRVSGLRGHRSVATGSQIMLLFLSSHIQCEDVIKMAAVVPQLRMLAWCPWLHHKLKSSQSHRQTRHVLSGRSFSKLQQQSVWT